MKVRVLLVTMLTASFALGASAYAKGKKNSVSVQFGMSQGRLGAQVMDMTEELRDFFGAPRNAGLLVSKVVADSPAAKAGVRVGDIIIEVAGERIDDAWDVLTTLADKGKGDKVSVVVIRNKSKVKLSATLTDAAGFALGGHGFHIGKGNIDIDLDEFDLDVDALSGLDALDGLDALGKMQGWSMGGGDKKLRERLEKTSKRLRELEKRLRALEKKGKK